MVRIRGFLNRSLRQLICVGRNGAKITVALSSFLALITSPQAEGASTIIVHTPLACLAASRLHPSFIRKHLLLFSSHELAAGFSNPG